MAINQPSTFFCHDCRMVTNVVVWDKKHWGCAVCGSQFVCDECGWRIDREGYCLRPATTGECSQTRESENAGATTQGDAQ
jgi:hypothetical protein